MISSAHANMQLLETVMEEQSGDEMIYGGSNNQEQEQGQHLPAVAEGVSDDEFYDDFDVNDMPSGDFILPGEYDDDYSYEEVILDQEDESDFCDYYIEEIMDSDYDCDNDDDDDSDYTEETVESDNQEQDSDLDNQQDPNSPIDYPPITQKISRRSSIGERPRNILNHSSHNSSQNSSQQMVYKSAAQKEYELEEVEQNQKEEQARKEREQLIAEVERKRRELEEVERKILMEEVERKKQELEAIERSMAEKADRERSAEIEAEKEAKRIAEENEANQRRYEEEEAKRIATENEAIRRKLQEEEERRRAAEEVAQRLAAEKAAAEEKARMEESKRRQEEEKARKAEETRRMEEEIMRLEMEVEAARKASEEAKKKQKEEKKRLKAKMKARRQHAKERLAAMNAAKQTSEPLPESSNPAHSLPVSPSRKKKGLLSMLSSKKQSSVSPQKATSPSSTKQQVAPTAFTHPVVITQTLPAPPVTSVSAREPVQPTAAVGTSNEGGEYYDVELLRRMIVPGLDYINREKYLSPSDFRQVFGMSKAEFDQLPKWKRTQLKRKQKLF